MDELNSGSHADAADLSKTFDQDETFNKVMHRCLARNKGRLVPKGTKCEHCGKVIEKDEH